VIKIQYLLADNARLFDECVAIRPFYPEIGVDPELGFLSVPRREYPSVGEVERLAGRLLKDADGLIFSMANSVQRRDLIGEYFQSLARLRHATAKVADAISCLRRSIDTLDTSSQKYAESSILLGQYLTIQEQYHEAETPCREGLRGCVRDRRIVRSTTPLYCLAVILANTDRTTEAIETCANLLEICARTKVEIYAYLSWALLANLLQKSDADDAIVLECLALSVAASAKVVSGSQSESPTAIFEQFASFRGVKKQHRTLILRAAEEKCAKDYGLEFLRTKLGLVPDIEAFLAVQGIT
jgi:tetratricopeptide (TPR) repeat protein